MTPKPIPSGRSEPKTMGTTSAQALQSEAYIHAILETAVDAIITIDQNGTILSFNRTATNMFGYTQNEVLGKNVKMLMPAPFQEQHDAYLSRYMKTGKARIIGIGREVLGLRRDGSKFPMDLAVSEVTGPEIRMFVGIIRDISERKYLEKALVSASENERREIGRDLHDALGQIITGISLLAKSLAKKLQPVDKKLADEADTIASLSMEAMAETKRLAYGAFPTELERQGLIPALIQLTETIRRIHRIETRLNAPEHWHPLDISIELHVYRIAQESMGNAVKHGKPKHIDLTLERTGDGVVLTVTDDGIGLSEKRDPNRISMGLDIMRHRAKLIGGSFDIKKRKTAGTEVICCIPEAFLVSRKT